MMIIKGDLSVAFLVNSGSEANDLALRMAHQHTGTSISGSQIDKVQKTCKY